MPSALSILAARSAMAHMAPKPTHFCNGSTYLTCSYFIMQITAFFLRATFALRMNGFIATRSVQNQNHGGLAFGVDPKAVIILPVGGFGYRV